MGCEGDWILQTGLESEIHGCEVLTLYDQMAGPKPMENFVTWMFWARAAMKWPHSWTVMMAASTPRALATDPGPDVSNPEPAGQVRDVSNRQYSLIIWAVWITV